VSLTASQQEIADLDAQGLSSAQIADKLSKDASSVRRTLRHPDVRAYKAALLSEVLTSERLDGEIVAMLANVAAANEVLGEILTSDKPPEGAAVKLQAAQAALAQAQKLIPAFEAAAETLANGEQSANGHPRESEGTLVYKVGG
jgi:hypothetical protein